MFNFIDIVGIIIIAVSAILALKKGFVKTFFSFVSAFVAVIFAFVFCNVGVEIIKNNTQIDEWLTTAMTESLNSYDETNEGVNDENIEETNSNFVTETLQNLPQNIKDMIQIEEYETNAKETLVDTTVEVILKILSWVTIYILLRLSLLIVCFILNGIMSIPLLKQINNLAGLALGVILGFFRIYMILAFISFFASVISMNTFITMIKNSMIISVMYENNILLSLIF